MGFLVPVAHFTRAYRFSASHRLHAPSLGEAENRVTYGKCNNPYGHGHNYRVEVEVAGPIREDTGFVVDLVKLDALAHHEIVSRFDHRNLNMDPAFSSEWVPTSENLTIEIERVMRAAVPLLDGTGRLRLASVRVTETPNNSFELPAMSSERLTVAAGGTNE